MPSIVRAAAYAENVRIPFANVEANVLSGTAAGPAATAPEVVNLDPWHGQTYCDASKPLTVQSACVQVDVSTVNVVSLVRAARNKPSDVLRRAAVPTDARVPEVGIVTDTTLPETDHLMWRAAARCPVMSGCCTH